MQTCHCSKKKLKSTVQNIQIIQKRHSQHTILFHLKLTLHSADEVATTLRQSLQT